jgi:hypothetical protein
MVSEFKTKLIFVVGLDIIMENFDDLVNISHNTNFLNFIDVQDIDF